MGEVARLGIAIAGGALFGPIGFAIGSLVGSLLFPQKIEGPRLQDLKLHNSAYGQVIPLVYGAMRVAGNVVWSTDLKEHAHNSGGKGGPEVKTYTYSASFAVYLCVGPINSVARIWADGKTIYDASGANGVSAVLPCTVYVGDEDQLPDPTAEAELGVGNVPAYRGTAYVVFTDWDLSDYGNRIPNLNFEVVQRTPPGSLSIIKSNYSEPVNIGGIPLILDWTDSTIVTAGTHLSSAMVTSVVGGQIFDPSDLSYVSTLPGGSGYSYPCHWDGPSPTYEGVGNYVTSAGQIWLEVVLNFAATSGDAVRCPILTPSATAPYDGFEYVPQDAAKFLHAAGVPDGEWLQACCLSQDGTQFWAFTAPTSLSNSADKWYKIVDRVVVAHGALDIGGDSFSFIGGGTTPHGVAGDGSIQQAAMMENNGRYLWIYDGPGGRIHIYYLGNDGTLRDWGNGSLAIPYGVDPLGIESAVRVIEDGTCGFAHAHALAVISRLPPVITRGIPLSEIVADVAARCDFADDEIDVVALEDDIVDGYEIARQEAARESLLELQSAYYWDAVESAGVMKCVKRGGDAVVTIPAAELAARADSGEAPAVVTTLRGQEEDIPAILTVKYINVDNDYETGAQISQRQVTASKQTKTIELAIAMNDGKAKQISAVLLFSAWVERNQHTFRTTAAYDYLEPTDVVVADGKTIRITQKKNTVAGVLEFDGVAALTSVWTQPVSAVSGSGITPVVSKPSQATKFLPLDLPLLTDSDSADAFYAAMAGAIDDTWRGANVYKSSDGGTTYAQVAASGPPAIIGATSDELGDFLGGNIFDESNRVTVVVGAGGGELSSATELAVLNGANLCLIGGELLQFKNATLTAPSTYELSGLLRGRRGTEGAIATHIAGDLFVMQPSQVPITFAELGKERLYKPVSFGASLGATTAVPFTDRGAALRCYAPVDLGGGFNGSGDVRITWKRRTRIGGDWADRVDVPLSEATESYVVHIYDSNYALIARHIQTASAFVDYEASAQVADFGATQEHIYFSVAQLGAYGLGTQAFGVCPGAGASDDSPLSPVDPYGATPPQGGSSCPGPVVSVNWPWSSFGRIVQDLDPSTTWLIDFTTGAVDGQAGFFNLYEFGGPPTLFTGYLSLSPCGTPIPGTIFSADHGPTVYFWVGTSAHGTRVRLDLNTKYYLNVKIAWVSSVAFTLSH